jgi:hypothetical protein
MTLHKRNAGVIFRSGIAAGHHSGGTLAQKIVGTESPGVRREFIYIYADVALATLKHSTGKYIEPVFTKNGFSPGISLRQTGRRADAAIPYIESRWVPAGK